MEKINKFKFKSIILSVLIIGILLSIFPPFVYGQRDVEQFENEEILEIIEDIIYWKKSDNNIDLKEDLFNNQFLKNFNDISSNLYAIGIGRLGYPDDYDAYLAVVSNEMRRIYLEEDKSNNNNKSIDRNQIALAILAMGGDPTNIGIDENKNPINLIKDTTYSRGKVKSLETQSINTWIWRLILLDSMRYEIPEYSPYTRDNIIEEIIGLQLEDGSFSINKDKADVHTTGLVVQALAPYYNSEQEYNYVKKTENNNVQQKVRNIVDDSLEYLSDNQTDSGGYFSQDEENLESIAQVIIALTSLGIDPTEDERFIKDRNTLLDPIKTFKMGDRGFFHSEVYDANDSTSNLDESNSMVNEQILNSLVSLIRLEEKHRSLYDFRQEITQEDKELIDSVIYSIDELSQSLSRYSVQRIFNQYIKVPITERSYVYNYKILSDAMESLNIENTSDHIAENISVNTDGNGTVTPIFDSAIIFNKDDKFVDKDIKIFENLPKVLTTDNYIEVIKLVRKLEIADNKREYSSLLGKLHSMREEISNIQLEINDLNDDIVDKLYPFGDISIRDKENIDNIVDRYNNLSEYDRTKVIYHKDVIRSKKKVENLIKIGIISIIIIVIILFILIFTIKKRIKRRKRRKIRDKRLYFDN